MKLHVQGHISPHIDVTSLRANCGNIRSGISLAFQGCGIWVIPYRDLKRLYEAATKVRAIKRGKP